MGIDTRWVFGVEADDAWVERGRRGLVVRIVVWRHEWVSQALLYRHALAWVHAHCMLKKVNHVGVRVR